MVNFNQLPNTVRLPLTYTEFDATGASEDLSSNPFTVLITGQMLTTGTAEEFIPVRPTTEAQAIALFGRGSMLARMCGKYLNANPVTKMIAIPVKDSPAGTFASGSISFTGTITTAAPLVLYIAGQKLSVATSAGMTETELVTALVDAVTAAEDLPVTASAGGNMVTFTAKNAGSCGNDIDIRFGYYDEDFPAGLTADISPMTGGAGDPDAAEIIASMGNDRYHFIAWPWTDAAALRELETEMDDRWGPLRQIDGQVVLVKSGTWAEAVTFSGSLNSKSFTVLPSEGSPTPPWEDCAASTAILAYYGNIDPARPFNTLAIPGVLPGKMADRFSDFPEKNQGLFEGLSARFVDPNGNVCFSNVITTYRFNALGAEDKAYLSLNSPLTLSYLRYDWNNYLKLKYPRHKLASDESAALYGPDQPIMTPKLGRAEAVARFQRWLEAGLVEGPSQFKKDLIVERNKYNENRLDFFLRPDLVNQFNVAGTLMRFLI